MNGNKQRKKSGNLKCATGKRRTPKSGRKRLRIRNRTGNQSTPPGRRAAKLKKKCKKGEKRAGKKAENGKTTAKDEGNRKEKAHRNKVGRKKGGTPYSYVQLETANAYRR